MQWNYLTFKFIIMFPNTLPFCTQDPVVIALNINFSANSAKGLAPLGEGTCSVSLTGSFTR